MKSIIKWIGGNELATWSALALIGLGLWGFVELADEVLDGDTHAFDRLVLIALRNPADLNDPLGPFWMEEIVRDFSAMGGGGADLLLLPHLDWFSRPSAQVPGRSFSGRNGPRRGRA